MEKVINLDKEGEEKIIMLQREPIVIGGGAVNSVNGQTGDVVLTTSDLENTSDYQTSSEVESAINTVIAGKQDTLTAGDNITIENNTISATDTTYTAGYGLALVNAEFSVDSSTIPSITDLDSKQNILEAGANITITGDVISASDTTYADFVGTDGQTTGTAGLVPAPVTTDVDKFLKSDGTWGEAGGGDSAAKVLSSADYNANSSNWGDTDSANFNCVALWKLDAGVYVVPNGVAVYTYASPWASSSGVYIVGVSGSYGLPILNFRYSSSNAGNSFLDCWLVIQGTGVLNRSWSLGDVENVLTSKHTVNPLSAAQGKALNDKITALEARVSALEGN